MLRKAIAGGGCRAGVSSRAERGELTQFFEKRSNFFKKFSKVSQKNLLKRFSFSLSFLSSGNDRIKNIRFKFINYNLWFSKNWKKEIAFLQRQNADIFTLQEVTRNLPKFGLDETDVFTELTNSFLSHRGIFAPITYKIENNKEIAFGNAIFSRFPIVSSKTYYYLKPLDWTDDYEN